MTEIDARADIEVFYDGDDLIAVIPLAGEVTAMWCRRYEALARARGLRAQARERKSLTVIHLAVPIRTESEEVLKMLDTARALIADADAVDRSPATSDAPEAIARRWWARQKA